MTVSQPDQRPHHPLRQQVENPEVQSEEAAFDHYQWDQAVEAEAPADAGGRAVLGWMLALLAIAWTGYASWSAGRALIGAPLTTPAIAQWVAVVAAPLGMLALAWIMFGRTRRKEAEKFTRSVVAMKAEARALEDQLSSLTRRIDDSRTALSGMANELDGMADAAVQRMTGATQAIEQGTAQLMSHGEAFGTSTTTALADMERLLAQLPDADARAQALGDQLRGIGEEAGTRSDTLASTIEKIGRVSASAEAQVRTATDALSERLAVIDETSNRTEETVTSAGETVDRLLATTAEALGEIRSGIDTQAAAVAALVSQAQAGISATGGEAAATLSRQIGEADSRLSALGKRVMAQDAATSAMIDQFTRGLSALDDQFQTLALNGDERAQSMQSVISGVREKLEEVAATAGAQDETLAAIGERASGLRDQVNTLALEVNDHLALALSESGEKAERLTAMASELAPSLQSMRDQAVEASERLSASASSIETSHERLGELMAGVDSGVGMAEKRMGELQALIAEIDGEQKRLSGETAPALVEAMIQVREAASHAGERARQAISAAIPASANELSDAARAALEKVVRESVEEQLRGVDALAARAVEAARGATDKLSAQMLSLGQTAGALEAYMNEIEADERAGQSEEFARRTAYLMESMHSAAIDVEKILSDEVDEKSWAAYLRGERGVFTRKAVKLLSSAEARAIGQHYAEDAEFQGAVKRYVQDYESMLRRVLAEREGEVMAVTLMSSDMGKLYAALAEVVAKRG
ncbi:hypothetical protein [Sphingomicrobium flavum]|uniref:hypothetical protein n=1 Tax=Sphingomicrobium flavum TaxID=1229164 RepID=UPI0021ADBB05|nr:hypothetical protein [Sphingomicrobium flavum]